MRAMMTSLLVLGTMVSGSVLAQTVACPGGTTRVTNGTPANPNSGGTFTNFITGATICAVRGSDRWQEFHASNFDLVDWKMGPGHAVDPREKVGTWSASNGANAAVTHDYGGGGVHTWAICRVGTGFTYTLVSGTGGTVTGATVLAGQVACP